MFLRCSGAEGLASQERRTYWGLFSAEWVLAWPWNCGRTASSGPTWDLEEGLCVRGAGMKDRTQDGVLGGDSKTPSQMLGTARDMGVEACVQRFRER